MILRSGVTRVPVLGGCGAEVLRDLATAVALGGDCPAGIAVTRAQPELIGAVAVDPTFKRDDGFHSAAEGIRGLKDTGLRNLPMRGFGQNRVWSEIVARRGLVGPAQTLRLAWPCLRLPQLAVLEGDGVRPQRLLRKIIDASM